MSIKYLPGSQISMILRIYTTGYTTAPEPLSSKTSSLSNSNRTISPWNHLCFSLLPPFCFPQYINTSEHHHQLAPPLLIPSLPPRLYLLKHSRAKKQPSRTTGLRRQCRLSWATVLDYLGKIQGSKSESAAARRLRVCIPLIAAC